MPSLDQVQKQLTDFIKGLSGKQRGLLIGAAVLTIGILAAFAHLISTPDYVPLMTGMEASDAQALGAKLAAKNIAYQISHRWQGCQRAQRQTGFEPHGSRGGWNAAQRPHGV